MTEMKAPLSVDEALAKILAAAKDSLSHEHTPLAQAFADPG